jgi:hypothetical protein
LPLDTFVSRAEPRSTSRAAGNPRVVVSAGHGWYWNERYSACTAARPLRGIVETSSTGNSRATCDGDGRRGSDAGGTGSARPSGALRPPGWQEGAVCFIKINAPGSVEHRRQRLRARHQQRPFYANWIGADFSVDSLAASRECDGPAAARARVSGSGILNTHIVRAIRRFYHADWPDRGLRSCAAAGGTAGGKSAMILNRLHGYEASRQRRAARSAQAHRLAVATACTRGPV